MNLTISINVCRRLFLLAMLHFSTLTPAQCQHQDLNLGIYNTLFGGITGGIGSIINKEGSTTQANWRKRFLRGFWQGSVGGLLCYSGKKTASAIRAKQNIGFAIPSKLLHSAGGSIIDNAALGRPFLKHWNMDFGLIRLDAEFGQRTYLKARFLPVGFYAAARASENSRFDLSTSLLTGQIVFRHNEGSILDTNGTIHGYSYGRAFTYLDDSKKYKTIAHEVVHMYQFKEYQVFNASIQKFSNRASASIQEVFKNWVYFDSPYQSAFYLLEGYHDHPHYFRNFYEFEAERFASNKFVATK
jgi:hypothetical protein